MATPINQVIEWLQGGDPARVDDDVMMFLSTLIHIEADTLLVDMRTREERRAALATLAPNVREAVEREVMAIWNKSQKS